MPDRLQRIPRFVEQPRRLAMECSQAPGMLDQVGEESVSLLPVMTDPVFI